MTRSQRSSKKLAQGGFASSLKSFLGHLEGTEKASHTIQSYEYDLMHFRGFLEHQGIQMERFLMGSLTRRDLERYGDYLKSEGLKTNTRRRRLMTLRKWIRYLNGRKRVEVDIGKKLQTPTRIEKVPLTVDLTRLLKFETPEGDGLALRNEILVRLLGETGILVSECVGIQWPEIHLEKLEILILGKNERRVKISNSLGERVLKFRGFSKNLEGAVFVGFNRFGPLHLTMTTRGVELLIKSLALKAGVEGVTPRVIRHSVVVEWFRQGISRDEIQKRLGLKTDASMRIYEPIFEAISRGIPH